MICFTRIVGAVIALRLLRAVIAPMSIPPACLELSHCRVNCQGYIDRMPFEMVADAPAERVTLSWDPERNPAFRCDTVHGSEVAFRCNAQPVFISPDEVQIQVRGQRAIMGDEETLLVPIIEGSKEIIAVLDACCTPFWGFVVQVDMLGDGFELTGEGYRLPCWPIDHVIEDYHGKTCRQVLGDRPPWVTCAVQYTEGGPPSCQVERILSRVQSIPIFAARFVTVLVKNRILVDVRNGWLAVLCYTQDPLDDKAPLNRIYDCSQIEKQTTDYFGYEVLERFEMRRADGSSASWLLVEHTATLRCRRARGKICKDLLHTDFDLPCTMSVGSCYVAQSDAPVNMPGLLTIIRKQRIKERQMRLLILGLDNAGKTTVVKSLCKEDLASISPTVGFIIKTIVYSGYTLNIWDVGGQQSLRPFWRNYFEATDAICWVVDSSDRGRLQDCKRELHDLLAEERLGSASILIFANKQDLSGALSCNEISQILDLDTIKRHDWRIQPCSALKAENLTAGFDWAVRTVSKRVYYASTVAISQPQRTDRLARPDHF
ncbi:uncharacterized protein L969DRAFT_93132 [Mixia osmundae IAM 14324]|uniref:uncharacterized protein n=1 Tax=Mixia osmundae (strain CBS 9802 / IAM 14324 / JCM 22182 / KY 12970) TaxID=764103 RepID=UPI0004A54B45|nr:uncharacterized protein L969DRAFT_93132 [Mixia osmundae IAM 14324]KEI40588.1 hypothetical protein L969DRAFT_93132 [Mixia osmundae IAM 14324]